MIRRQEIDISRLTHQRAYEGYPNRQIKEAR